MGRVRARIGAMCVVLLPCCAYAINCGRPYSALHVHMVSMRRPSVEVQADEDCSVAGLMRHAADICLLACGGPTSQVHLSRFDRILVDETSIQALC